MGPSKRRSSRLPAAAPQPCNKSFHPPAYLAPPDPFNAPHLGDKRRSLRLLAATLSDHLRRLLGLPPVYVRLAARLGGELALVPLQDSDLAHSNVIKSGFGERHYLGVSGAARRATAGVRFAELRPWRLPRAPATCASCACASAIVCAFSATLATGAKADGAMRCFLARRPPGLEEQGPRQDGEALHCAPCRKPDCSIQPSGFFDSAWNRVPASRWSEAVSLKMLSRSWDATWDAHRLGTAARSALPRLPPAAARDAHARSPCLALLTAVD